MLRTQSQGRLWAALLLLTACLLAPMLAQAQTLDSEATAFIGLINTYRQQNGLVPLKLSAKLNASAAWMSTDMGQKNYFSHTDSLGRTFDVRLRAFGYTYNTYMGENIAAGNSTASATFTQWKNSPGHNANMLNSHYVVMGIARVYAANSTYKWYWTNDFGGYDDSVPAPAGDTTPPQVTITAPLNGAAVQGKIVVQATATDNVGVHHCVFTVDNAAPIGDYNAPYELYVDTTTLVNGAHTVTIAAFDAAGNTAKSVVSFTVTNPVPDTIKPVASLTMTPSGATVSGRVVFLATATDNVGVAKVVFALENGTTVTAHTAPYAWYFYTTTIPNGAHTCTATAYDAAGNSAGSTVAFTVKN